MTDFEKLIDEFGALCNQEGLTGSENATDAANVARAALFAAHDRELSELRTSAALLVKFWDEAAKCDECDEEEALCESHRKMQEDAVYHAREGLKPALGKGAGSD